MLSLPLIPTAEATVFILGCAIIQAQRHRASQMTGPLVVMALAAMLAIAFLIMPEEQLNMAALATAMADMGDSLPMPLR